MSEDQVKKLYNGITNISEEIIEEAQTAKPRRKLPIWARWAAAAACVCLVAVGVFVWKQPSESFADANANDSGINVSEDGVTIPPLNVTLSMPPDVEACWAYAFFIYQGRCYVSYDGIYKDVDIIGKHLGTATGMLDVWTPKEGYVDFAGNIEGDFYSVRGYDPSFMLCMKYEDGSISTFLCNNGITLKTGYDLYEERLHLSENYAAVQYETRASWYNSADEVYQLNEPKGEAVTAFVEALNTAEFMPTADIPLEEGETSVVNREIYHLYFLMENGISVHLRLYKGGYVRFEGLWDVCVQIPDEQFDAMVALLSDPDAGALAEQHDDSPSLEDCRNDASFGMFVPAYIPDEMDFESAQIRYFLGSATGNEIGTKEINLDYSGEFDLSDYYITIAWADDYGENGWAGPMLDHSELSKAALAEYVQTESASGRPLSQSQIHVGVWYGDVSVALSGYGLDAETTYQIFASIEGK